MNLALDYAEPDGQHVRVGLYVPDQSPVLTDDDATADALRAAAADLTGLSDPWDVRIENDQWRAVLSYDAHPGLP